jgi:hypothetical protein
VLQKKEFSISAANNYAIACFFSCELNAAEKFLEVQKNLDHAKSL